jgi:hypothetical protein
MAKTFKGIVFVIVITILSLHFGLAQEKPEEQSQKKGPKSHHYFLNASIFYPLSINKTKDDSANINLSLFYGHIGSVEGVDLGGLVSVIKKRLKGLQITGAAGITGDYTSGIQISGLFNIAGDELKGAQFTGIGNIVGEDSSGIQGAGIFNITGNDFSGLQQGSGIFNITGEGFTGVQGCGIFNIVGEDFKGIQAGGIFNITGGKFNGLQAAGIFNIAGDYFNGLQAAIINITPDLQGIQVGLVNAAETVKGAQVGIVNLSKKMQGVPVGLVNLSKDGRIRMTTWGSSVTAVNTGVKFMVKNIYSILSIGGIDLFKGTPGAISYGFHYGLHIPVNNLFVDIDLGYMYLDYKTWFKSTAGTRDRHVLKIRGMLGIDISKKFSIFAGTGLRHIWDHAEVFRQGNVKPLFFAGIELF